MNDTYLKGLPTTGDLTGQNLGGLTLTPGVYNYNSSAQLTGALTIDFTGLSNKSIVFQIGSTLTTASASSIISINGNATNKVYFVVGSSATLGTDTMFEGNILSYDSISLNNGAKILNGGAMALTGAVTMIGNTISAASVSPIPLPAALPLLGMAVAGLFGFRKKSAKTQEQLRLYPESL
jgi:type VI secretion system secreted protein VgrG